MTPQAKPSTKGRACWDSPTQVGRISRKQPRAATTLRDIPESIRDLRNLAASYEHAICRHLTGRLQDAIRRNAHINEVHLVGGVSANVHLRSLSAQLCQRHGLTLRHPSTIAYCTDNAAMIAAAGFFAAAAGAEPLPFETHASLGLEEALR